MNGFVYKYTLFYMYIYIFMYIILDTTVGIICIAILPTLEALLLSKKDL